MTRYKHADFEEDDVSSVGSVHLTEGVSSTATHIRYHTVRTRCPLGLSVWRSRTLLEKVLLLTTASLFLLTMLLSMLLSTAPGHQQHPDTKDQFHVVPRLTEKPSEKKPCLTPGCVKLAANLLTAMNSSVQPCDDFYQYACGNWERANPIPDGKSIWGTFRKLEQQNLLVVRTILEQPILPNRDGKAEQKAKMYYASCVDVNETVESLGAKPMLDLLQEVGGWNATTPGWNATAYNFQKTLKVLHNKYYMSGLFSWDVSEDDRNSSRHIIQVDQGGLMLPTRESYLNKTENAKLLAAYLEYMTKICNLLRGDENNDNSCKTQMADVIDFETTLAGIMASPEERRDEEKMYQLKTVADLQKLAPFINWAEYFSDAMHFQGRKVGSNEKVVIYSLQYLQNLTDVINEHLNTTKGRIVVNNYLVWQTVRTLSPYLSRAFRDAHKGLRKAMLGSEGGEEPWRVCVADTNSVLGFATGAMFVKNNNFRQKMSKSVAEKMIESVRKAFKTNLKNLKWMDEATKAAALEKADAISDMIGYPDFILDVKKLDEKYQDLDNIKEDTYFQNNIEVSKYNMQKQLEKLDKPVDKTVWGMSPPTVNAYYTATKNQIAFPAGILQPPFFDPVHPMSVNYGAMGVVMGHELTHAFDDHGREYDQSGNLKKWWNGDTVDEFNNQAGCIADQYSKYKVKGKNLNGNHTLGENIADNGGLKAAYHAYLEWAKENDPEPLLPGLDHDHRKLFFLSFAQVWCSASTDEALSLQIDKDPHPPPKFRVIGSLSNLPEFAQVFECKENAPMNPRHKCGVW